MATIDRRNTSRGVRYRARVRMDGVAMTRSFPTKREASDWARHTESQIRGGNAVQIRVTVGELIDRYLADVLPYKARNKDQRHPARHLRYWRQELGSLPLGNLTADLLHQQRAKLLNGRAPSTVNRYMAALSRALTEAVRWNWLHSNPARDLQRLQEPPGRDRVLTDSERVRLLAACDADLYLLVVLALSTAARSGELYRLTWRNIDLDRGHVTFVNTKNGQTRGMVLTGKALELLRAREQLTDKVFPARMRKRWIKALAVADVKDFHFHDLRHTAATFLAKNGATALEIAQITGHASMQMVKRYTHLSVEHTAAAAAHLSKVFDE